MKRWFFAFLLTAACTGEEGDTAADTDADKAKDSDSDSDTDADECSPNPLDPTKYVIIGFWDNDPTCSGDPMIENAFPVVQDAPCYCWPGNSGENSADTFSCDTEAMTFTYTQYNTLTCGEGDNTPTVKTIYSDKCEQDIPENLYSKIIDFGACDPT